LSWIDQISNQFEDASSKIITIFFNFFKKDFNKNCISIIFIHPNIESLNFVNKLSGLVLNEEKKKKLLKIVYDWIDLTDIEPQKVWIIFFIFYSFFYFFNFFI
jgi:phosphoserine aminotransferase